MIWAKQQYNSFDILDFDGEMIGIINLINEWINK